MFKTFVSLVSGHASYVSSSNFFQYISYPDIFRDFSQSGQKIPRIFFDYIATTSFHILSCSIIQYLS